MNSRPCCKERLARSFLLQVHATLSKVTLPLFVVPSHNKQLVGRFQHDNARAANPYFAFSNITNIKYIYKLKEKSLQSPISIYPRNISGYLKNIQSSKPSTIKKLHASIPLYCFSFESIRISAIFFVSVCRHFKLKSIILNIDYITHKIAFVRSLHTGIAATIFG